MVNLTDDPAAETNVDFVMQEARLGEYDILLKS